MRAEERMARVVVDRQGERTPADLSSVATLIGDRGRRFGGRRCDAREKLDVARRARGGGGGGYGTNRCRRQPEVNQHEETGRFRSLVSCARVRGAVWARPMVMYIYITGALFYIAM